MSADACWLIAGSRGILAAVHLSLSDHEPQTGGRATAGHQPGTGQRPGDRGGPGHPRDIHPRARRRVRPSPRAARGRRHLPRRGHSSRRSCATTMRTTRSLTSISRSFPNHGRDSQAWWRRAAGVPVRGRHAREGPPSARRAGRPQQRAVHQHHRRDDHREHAVRGAGADAALHRPGDAGR